MTVDGPRGYFGTASQRGESGRLFIGVGFVGKRSAEIRL